MQGSVWTYKYHVVATKPNNFTAAATTSTVASAVASTAAANDAAASGNDDASLVEEMRTKIRSTPGINLDQFSAFLENSLANNIN